MIAELEERLGGSARGSVTKVIEHIPRLYRAPKRRSAIPSMTRPTPQLRTQRPVTSGFNSALAGARAWYPYSSRCHFSANAFGVRYTSAVEDGAVIFRLEMGGEPADRRATSSNSRSPRPHP